MVYRGTYTTERLMFHNESDPNEVHFIALTKSADAPTFYVTCCCDEEWGYEFYIENNSDYERVKFNIMEAMFDCESMTELLDELSEIFEDGFEGLLVCDCCDCFNCENCNNDYEQ